MKVALVHDWLTGMRGGEKVLEEFCRLFPDADIFTLLHVKGSVSPTIESRRIVTSPLQYFPQVGKRYRQYLPILPWAVGRLDLRGYELVVSVSHCVAKGVRVPAGVPHVCYCNAPMRFVWDQYPHYFGPGRASLPVRMAMGALAPSLRRWDVKTAAGVTRFIGNSGTIVNRIKRYYGLDAEIVYPAVDVDFFPLQKGPREDFYLMVSAFAPYKRVDIAIDAFNRLGKRLVIVGKGQDERALRAQAGATVEFKGWASDRELAGLYGRCRALIFPGEEDFGIVPVEAMAAGSPVIAFGRGGVTETVVEGETGVFFPEQTPESLAAAVRRFETLTLDPALCRARAEKFNPAVFVRRIQSLFQNWGLPVPARGADRPSVAGLISPS